MLGLITNDSVTTEKPDEEEYIEYKDRWEPYIVPVIFGVIFLVGVIGNGCLIYILCRHKSMRSVPNTFIFNLAVGDLLVLVCAVPFTSTVYSFDSWLFGEFVCKVSEFAKDTSVGVSVFTLTALSLDRYTAIVRPVQSFVGGPKSKMVIIILVLIWFSSLLMALPAAIFSHLLMLTVTNKTITAENGTVIGFTIRQVAICYPFPEEFGPVYPQIIILTRFILQYCLPLLIIGSLYIIMAHHLLRSIRTIPGQATLTTASVHRREGGPSKTEPASLLPQQPNQNRTRRKLAKMVLTFVVLFAVCLLPSNIFLLWFYYDPESQDNFNYYWHSLKIIGFILAYSNSCINPVALYCVSTSFRKHFNRLFWCCKGGASAETVSGVSVGLQPSTRDDGVLTEEPASTAISQFNNSRRTIVVATTNSRSFRAPGGGSLARHPSREGESYPLNELTRQRHVRQEQTAC